MQKALKWLDAHNIPYAFHDYKEHGIDEATLKTWLKHFATDKLINTRGTTYRALATEEKAGVADTVQAIPLMMKNTSLIKRPVWSLGDGRYYLGWNEQEIAAMLL